MDEAKIKNTVREAYGLIARRQTGRCCPSCGPDGATFAKSIGYSEKELAAIPDGANVGLSCGNPTALASPKKGEVVLDLGSGAGFDCFVVASKVGPAGKVIGVDMKLAEACCYTPDTQDPLGKAVLAGLKEGESIQDYVTSVYVEGYK